MISYKFNKATGIVETFFKGEIDFTEMLEYIIAIREDKQLPSRIKILSDTTKANLKEKFSSKELQQFLEENKMTLEQKEFIYDAFVISGSFEMALGMLYKELIEINNYKFNVFSSKDAAIEWLQMV